MLDHLALPIKILLVDNQVLLRDGVRALIGPYRDIKIVGETSEVEDAIRKIRELRPDVVLLGLHNTDKKSLEIIRQISANKGKGKILVFTQCEDKEHALLAMKAGANGYVPKQATGLELVSAIQTIGRGEGYLYPSITSILIEDYRNQLKSTPGNVLTDRQKEILKLVVGGHTNAEIAGKLFIEPKTIIYDRIKIKRKLDAHNYTELVKYAVRNGLAEVTS